MGVALRLAKILTERRTVAKGRIAEEAMRDPSGGGEVFRSTSPARLDGFTFDRRSDLWLGLPRSLRRCELLR
jgi:hypothetical protein